MVFVVDGSNFPLTSIILAAISAGITPFSLDQLGSSKMGKEVSIEH